MKNAYQHLLLKLGLDAEEFEKRCKTLRVEWQFAAAICMAESGGDPYAVRYEPHYRWLYKVKKFAEENRITKETEKALQKMSWGAFQLMGGLLRELGYPGPLVLATDPSINMSWALVHIAGLFRKYLTNENVAAAYNAGSPRKKKFKNEFVNQKYVNRVMAYYRELKADSTEFTS